jgi:aminoglycoside 6'-N-acetyltransferase-1b
MFNESPDITFRWALLSDAPLLFRWRQTPHVARWWNIAPYEANTLEEMERELEEDFALGEHESLLILLDGKPIGYAQTYNAGQASGGWWPDEDDSTRGLDLFIGQESLIGHGLGPLIVRAICERLFGEAGVTSIIVDPHPDNLRSVRCFEKAGFERERHLETPDGEALLMRLRRDEG